MNDNGPRKDQTEPLNEAGGASSGDTSSGVPNSNYTVADRPGREGHTPRYGFQHWTLAAISPFVYLFLGFIFGWWAWAWIIIPVCGILGAPMNFWVRCVSLSPFVYLLLGFFFGWWAWAWIIIPVFGILSSGIYKRA